MGLIEQQPEAAGHRAEAGQCGLIRASEHPDCARPRILGRAQRGAAQGQVLRLLEQTKGDNGQIYILTFVACWTCPLLFLVCIVSAAVLILMYTAEPREIYDHAWAIVSLKLFANLCAIVISLH